MEYRLLGRSGLKVSVMAIGTATFGGGDMVGNSNLSQAERQIDMCLDAGVNLIDTADVYGQGASEEIVGQALERGRRNRLILASKLCGPVGDGPNDRGLSRPRVIAQCEASLRRLRTDVIDLYQMHQWDGLTPIEETLEAFDALRRQGKIRYIGASNFSGWHLMKALAASDSLYLPRPVSQQIHYTLHSREAEYELVPIALDQGVGIMVWSPLAGGLLSGKYRRDRRPDQGRHLLGYTEPPVRDWETLYDIIDAIVAIANGRGVTGAQVALAWLLGRPGVATVVIGGRNDTQFQDNLAAAELTLSHEERRHLDDVSIAPLIYPYWHQNAQNGDRLGSADLSLHAPYRERTSTPTYAERKS